MNTRRLPVIYGIVLILDSIVCMPIGILLMISIIFFFLGGALFMRGIIDLKSGIEILIWGDTRGINNATFWWWGP